jgi:hypothetical protein
MGRIQVMEAKIVAPQSGASLRKIMEDRSDDINAIYPEIRAITAARVTRNKTYYPAESLIGSVEAGSGIYSLLDPYPVPVIRDHNATPGMLGGESSPIYGRVKYAKFVSDGAGGGYVSVVPEISDPKAIQMILSERFLTVSIGVETDSVRCSICGQGEGASDTQQDYPCTHVPGNTYIVDGVPREAYRIIGPVWFEEISFVTIPSDTTARVLSKSVVQNESLPLLGIRSERDGDISIKGKEERFAMIRETWNKSSKIFGSGTIVAQTGSLPFNSEAQVVSKVGTSTMPKEGSITVKSVDSALDKANSQETSGGITAIPLPVEPRESESFGLGSKNPDDKPSIENVAIVDETIPGKPEESLLKECDMKKPEEHAEATSGVEIASGETVANTRTESGSNPTEFHKDETVVALTQVREALLEEIAGYKEQIASFENKCLELSSESHKHLAFEVALLSKVLRKVVTRNKSTEEYAKELRKRSSRSLGDTLGDLLMEYGDSAPVETALVEKIVSPVLKTDESREAMPPATIESSEKGRVSAIEETSDDSVYAHFGVKPKLNSVTPTA